MKIGEDAIPAAGFQRLPTSVRSILIDVFEHENSTIGEIADRTGFPQSHVSAAVARLREGGVLLVTSDPGDRRRTRVRTSPEIPRRAAEHASAHIDGALAAALGTEDHGQVAEAAAALELLARRLIPNGIPDTCSAPGETTPSYTLSPPSYPICAPRWSGRRSATLTLGYVW